MSCDLLYLIRFKFKQPQLFLFLCSYYDELVSLDTKLAGSTPQIPFKWKDAFDKGSLFTGRASLSTDHNFVFKYIYII